MCPPAVTVSPLPTVHVVVSVVIKPTPGGDGRCCSWGHQCKWESEVPLVFGGTRVCSGHSRSPVPGATRRVSWAQGAAACCAPVMDPLSLDGDLAPPPHPGEQAAGWDLVRQLVASPGVGVPPEAPSPLVLGLVPLLQRQSPSAAPPSPCASPLPPHPVCTPLPPPGRDGPSQEASKAGRGSPVRPPHPHPVAPSLISGRLSGTRSGESVWTGLAAGVSRTPEPAPADGRADGQSAWAFQPPPRTGA